MKVFIAFLLASFVLGGTRWSHIATRRPVVFGFVCLVAGASFYSLRVIG